MTINHAAKSLLAHTLVNACSLCTLLALEDNPAAGAEPVAKDEKPTNEEKPAADSEGPRASKQIATLTGRDNVEWVAGAGVPIKSPRIRSGQTLAFKSGLVEIKYDTGVRVVIEGPAEYAVGVKNEGGRTKEDENSGFLQLGKLVARVKGEKAKGFVIDTPNAKIIDVVGEIAVEARANGATYVLLLTGKAEVVREASKIRPEQRVRLTEGEDALVPAKGGAITRQKKVDNRVKASPQVR